MQAQSVKVTAPSRRKKSSQHQKKYPKLQSLVGFIHDRDQSFLQLRYFLFMFHYTETDASYTMI